MGLPLPLGTKMFDTGKTYKVNVKSDRADGTVFKFDRGGKECILNPQSPFFYAEPEDGKQGGHPI